VKRAILLVDHGSRHAEANAVLTEVAKMLRKRLPERIIEIAHMELAPPSVAEGIAACLAGGAGEIVVHPYFLTPGQHSSRDIPQLVAEALAPRSDVKVRVTEPLGAHPGLVDAIPARIDAGGTSRGSGEANRRELS
jgi:sirohydrochlorin ferrochelatase